MHFRSQVCQTHCYSWGQILPIFHVSDGPDSFVESEPAPLDRLVRQEDIDASIASLLKEWYQSPEWLHHRYSCKRRNELLSWILSLSVHSSTHTIQTEQTWPETSHIPFMFKTNSQEHIVVENYPCAQVDPVVRWILWQRQVRLCELRCFCSGSQRRRCTQRIDWRKRIQMFQQHKWRQQQQVTF